VLYLEPGPLGALLTLEARVSAPGLDDVPRTWRQLDLLSGELKRHPTLFAPPEARLLRALTSAEFALPLIPGGTRIELTSERMQALMDRVPESPHFTWDPRCPNTRRARRRHARRARQPAHGRSARRARVRRRRRGPRLELALEWPGGVTRALSAAVLLTPLGLTVGGRTHVALAGGKFVRIVDEPPKEVVKLLQEGGLALQRKDGAVLDRLARSFPVVRSAMRRLTRVHDVDVLGSFELATDDWLRVRVFASSRAAQWVPGVIAPEGAVFEYRPALGWVRLEPDDTVIRGLEAVDDTLSPIAPSAETAIAPEAEPAAASELEAAAQDMVAEGGHEPPPSEVATRAEESGEGPERAWFELPDPEHVAPIVEWVEMLPQGDMASRKKRAPKVPLGAPSGWWLRLTPHVLESLADAWEARPQGVRWYADPGAAGLFKVRRAVPQVRVRSTGLDWFTVSAEWQAEGLSLKDEDLSILRASRDPFVKLSSGWVRRADLETFDDVSRQLADLGLEPGAGEVRVPLWQLAQADPKSLDSLEAYGASAGDLERCARCATGSRRSLDCRPCRCRRD
jgi:hypothetical protein